LARALDNNASLTNAGVAYVVLKDWDARAKQPGQDLRSSSTCMVKPLALPMPWIGGGTSTIVVAPSIAARLTAASRRSTTTPA
jgi:HAE1 family hydrophobic/amphiphilic exporter-1